MEATPSTGVFSIMKKAPVNKIIQFSNVDGPGNRTAVFFQGCTFNCMFCHNPETINMCRSCGICVSNCPAGALSIGDDGAVIWDSGKCVQCDTCIKLCPHDASPRVTWMSVEEVMQQIKRCAPYIDGITCSGGECTLQAGFMTELFSEVKKLGKTCLIDSNGSFDFERDPEVLKNSLGVMLDVKAADRAWSETLISNPGDMVRKNLVFLKGIGKLFEVRTIIFPGRDAENEFTVRYVAEKIGDSCPYKIIRYRPFGVRERYQKLLGEDETDIEYAESYAQLARDLGAAKAYVV